MAKSQSLQIQECRIAIEISLNITENNYVPTSEEQLILKNFVGFGGLKALLYPLDREWNTISKISQSDLKLETEVKDFYKFIQEKFPSNFEFHWNSIKESILTSFYTPIEIVEEQILNIKENNPNSIQRILEPSAGNGVYVDAITKHFPSAEIIAIEKDFISSLILKARFFNNENVTIYQNGFEDVVFNDKFDLITSNIPFGNFKVQYQKYDNKITDKIHNFFFYHSANLLREGGVLSFLTSTGVFNSGSNQYVRKKLAEQLEFVDITTMPENLFSDAGTIVTSHIVQGIKNTRNRTNEIEDFNNQFITTTTYNEGEYKNIQLNSFVYNNLDKSFLAKPKVDTNPYGNLELNYKLDLRSTLQLLRLNFTKIPQLNIEIEQINNVNEELKFQKFPLSNYDISNLKVNDELLTLRNRSLIEPINSLTYRNLGIVTVNYRGITEPIASFAKILDFDKDNKPSKKYIIDYYINNNDKLKGTKILRAKDFKNEFLIFTEELKNLASEHSLEISIHGKRSDADSLAFEEYFLNQFEQPLINKTYQTVFNNFTTHNLITEGSLVLTEKNQPAYVSNIFKTKDNLSVYELSKLDIKESENDFVIDYLLLYDAYNLLINASVDSNDSFRIRLNNQYDNFISSYGFINENIKRIEIFDKNYIQILKTLENKSDLVKQQIDLFSTETKQSWTKADIFNSDFSHSAKLTPLLALSKSFNVKGAIDVDYIAQLTETSSKEVLEALKDKIILNPLNNNYELRSVFFSGNLKNKINHIHDLKNSSNENIINELTALLPETIPFEAISIQFGSRWIPKIVFDDFLNKYFDQKFDTLYNSNLDTFHVEHSGIGSTKYRSYNYVAISNRKIAPEDIIYNAFYDIYPIATYTDADKVRHTDEDATKYYKREITRLRKDFNAYISNLSPEQKEELTKLYNDTFNNLVIPKFDSDILDFSEFNLEEAGITSIYDHQKRAPWKIINNEGGIVDHEVGLGKTFEIVATAYFGKALGTFKKPIILGLKANVSDLVLAYRTLLPQANILFASEKDYTTKQREVFLNKIRNNHYDAIIMTHEQFSAIPQSQDVEIRIVRQELRDIEDNLTAANGLDISKKQLKGLEIRKKNLTIQMGTLMDRLRANKDENVLSFENLGIDHIIVDESHKFKNLMFQTKHNRVAGLGKVDGSLRSNNLLTAIRTLQEKTRTGEFGATFFSGTPISNSITELYALQKYLTPVTLKERGLLNFDAWCSNFAQKSIEFETNMVNQIISKERFRYFVNLPELSQMYNYMTDVMTGQMAKIDRPEKNQFLLLNEQTPLQKRFYFKLSKFLQTKDQSILKLDKPLNIDSNSPAISITAMNLAFKASIDMRLISSQYGDEPQSKVNVSVNELIKRYNKFSEQKITQIVFLDISTPKSKLSFEQLDENYKNGIFTSLYDDIKYKLIKAGIPEEEIAFIQNYKTEKHKKALSEKMNNGEIRILLGATDNAGTGLNVQHRLGYINHLSIPWKPSELDQRDGRGFRKGNWIAKNFMDNKIDISLSATKDTFDNFKIDGNKIKSNFIEQLKGSAIGLQVSRTLDEGVMDENTGMGLAELQAQLTGDDSLLKKLKIDNKIKELEQDKLFNLSRKKQAEHRIENSKDKIQRLLQGKEIFIADYETLQKNAIIGKDGSRQNKPVYFGLKPDAKTDEIHQHLKKVYQEVDKLSMYSTKPVAEMYGFELYAMNDAWLGPLFKVKNKELGTSNTYSINESQLNLDSAQSCITFFSRTLDTIKSRMNNVDENVQREQSRMASNQLNTVDDFEYEDLLQNYILQSQELEEHIKNSNQTSSVQYPVINKIIGEDEISFKVITSSDVLNRAILMEHLGTENDEIGLYCNNVIKSILQSTAEIDNSGFSLIRSNYENEEKLHFLKFRINDYDEFYVKLSRVLDNKEMLNINIYNEYLEKGFSDFFLKTEENNYFCTDGLANTLIKELDHSYNTIKGVNFINISENHINELLDNLEFNFNIKTKIIDPNNDNNILRKL